MEMRGDMGKRYYLKGLIVGLLLSLWLCTTLYAQANIITSVPCDGKSYTVQFSGNKAMLSRDGARAIPIVAGTKVTKPGTYYLSIYEEMGLRILTFKIKGEAKSSWSIEKESDLKEILKNCVDNYQSTVTLRFNGVLTANYVEQTLSNYIDVLKEEYPMLMLTSYAGTVYKENNKQTRVELSLKYPLKVTSTLKKYDAQALSSMNNMVNTSIKAQMKDYEMEQILLQKLMDQVTYSFHDDQSINATSMTHTLQGAFNGNQNIVCDGYAKSFMYLMNMVGIPTQLVIGTSIDETGAAIGHAWNLIKIQGAYYHVDSTWADQGLEAFGTYNYINEQDSYMIQTHKWDQSQYPKATTKDYTFLYSPLLVAQVTRVTQPSDLEKALTRIAEDKVKNGTLVLQNQSKWHWQEKEVLREIGEALATGYSYRSEEKYDCIVIDYIKE